MNSLLYTCSLVNIYINCFYIYVHEECNRIFKGQLQLKKQGFQIVIILTINFEREVYKPSKKYFKVTQELLK